MLRKQVYFSVAIVSIALLFLGCFSIQHRVVYDPDLPKEQAAVVIFDDTIMVLQFNGTDVKDAWYPNKGPRTNKVALPAGAAAITLNYSKYHDMGNTTYHLIRNGLELRFDFEAGKNYAVGAYVERGESKGFLQGNKWTFGIGVWSNYYDVGKKEKAIRSWELGEH